MDDDIESFMTITGVESRDVARGYLQISGGDPNRAIMAYYENPELESSFNNNASSAPRASSQQPGTSNRAADRRFTGREDAHGVVHIDSDSDGDDTDDDDVEMNEGNDQGEGRDVASIARNAQEEEDAAMARRLQEELYGSGPGSGAADDGVRAPIAQTTETLAGPDMSWGLHDDPRAAMLEHIGDGPSRLRRQNRNHNPFDQGPSIWDDGAAPPSYPPQQNDENENLNSRAALLRDLFRPPHDLMSDATWDEARDEGKEEKKWIMVNLQDLDIFQCQTLNRDVWKDEKVKSLIKEHFIFLQYDKKALRAQSFVQLYFPNGAHENSDNFPHVSIIDPRTGEQVKVWSGQSFPPADDFYRDVVEFLDRYSLAANSKNPVLQSKPKSRPVDIGRLTEEEMLEIAMQNSLENNGGSMGSSVQDPDLLTKAANGTGKGKARETDEVSDSAGGSAQLPADASDALSESIFSQISSTNSHIEPENNPATTTRIQFRHSGGRIIRRFAVTDTVSRIYEWLKADPFEGKEGILFELKAMPAGADLINDLDQTIDEAGLKQGTVMIEFIED